MNWLLLLKWIHILAAITAVGANFTYGVWSTRGKRESSELRFALRGIAFIDNRIANPAYGLLFLTGLLMAIFYVGFHLWVFLGIGIFVTMAIVGGALYGPTVARQLALVERDGAVTSEYSAADARARGAGIFLAILAAAVVFVMVFKPQ